MSAQFTSVSYEELNSGLWIPFEECCIATIWSNGSIYTFQNVSFDVHLQTKLFSYLDKHCLSCSLPCLFSSVVSDTCLILSSTGSDFADRSRAFVAYLFWCFSSLAADLQIPVLQMLTVYRGIFFKNLYFSKATFGPTYKVG